MESLPNEGNGKEIGDIWTSGTNQGCESSFHWCSKGVDFRRSGDVKWGSGEPGANHNCVYLQQRNVSEQTFLKTSNCSFLKDVVCEVIYIIGVVRVKVLTYVMKK
jgi:hypothetical protein